MFAIIHRVFLLLAVMFLPLLTRIFNSISISRFIVYVHFPPQALGCNQMIIVFAFYSLGYVASTETTRYRLIAAKLYFH